MLILLWIYFSFLGVFDCVSKKSFWNEWNVYEIVQNGKKFSKFLNISSTEEILPDNVVCINVDMVYFAFIRVYKLKKYIYLSHFRKYPYCKISTNFFFFFNFLKEIYTDMYRWKNVLFLIVKLDTFYNLSLNYFLFFIFKEIISR